MLLPDSNNLVVISPERAGASCSSLNITERRKKENEKGNSNN